MTNELHESPTEYQGPAAFRFEDFAPRPVAPGTTVADHSRSGELSVRIELGRAQLHLQQVMAIRSGSVVTLDTPADCGVDIYVEGRLIARGDVLVHEGNFCVRVTELTAARRAAA
jgi:flagellar motor switch protein FliN/FliY